jgi:two-component system response regulator QseB
MSDLLILVIEDDPTIAVFMEWALTAEGHRVVIAPDAQAALHAVAREMPALILLDMNLPTPTNGQPYQSGQAGTALFRQLRERHVNVPTIAVTADPRAAEAALQQGITDTLLKPFDLDDLFAIINRHTGTSHD